jgi:assimilatory nitrate reductase catalytic subunit
MVRVTQSVRPGNIFVPFHYNTQLVNALTNDSFCPKSGEPNFKQTAIQLHSKEVPNGLEFAKQEISGEIEHIKTTYEGIKIQERVLSIH